MADAVGVFIVILLALFGILIVLTGAAILFVIVYAAVAVVVRAIMEIFQK